jgi:uncharacterized protein (DUF1501 family)
MHSYDLFHASRRRFLGGGAALASALGLGSLASLAGSGAAAATDDYKALVCLFMFGGNDGQNMVPPYDTTRHAAYVTSRGALALPRASLVPLGTDYALHPSMSALAAAWSERALIAVHNVGPLYAPITKTQFRSAPAGSPLIPDALYSHSDQQLLWQSSTTSAQERTGWGGRASAVLGTVNPVISFGGNANFGLTDLGWPLVLPGPGSSFGLSGFSTSAPVVARRNALNQVMAEVQRGPLAEAFARGMRQAFDLEGRLAPLFPFNPDPAADPTGITGAFASLISNGQIRTSIARQLYQVARFVANRATVQGTRQIFFVQLGGFDTHQDQIAADSLTGTHANLLKQMADAMAAFWNALKAIGMGDRVTLFTQSDFARTYMPNESRGTDHAWGNEQLVLGGAVIGNTTYGRYPVLQPGGPDDVGVNSWELQGRWIPTTSVDQYAATMLRWWGMSEAQLDAALPNLRNFGSARDMGFMRLV